MTEDPKYRFRLRRGRRPFRTLGICMINPSQATDEFIDDKTSNDNTIRSLIRIAEFNQFDAIFVTNVAPYRATDPKELVEAIRAGVDVFKSHENAAALADMASSCERIVCAWGAAAGLCSDLEKRASDVRAFLLILHPLLYCFGRTKTGWPKHPLYLPRETPIVPFASRSES